MPSLLNQEFKLWAPSWQFLGIITEDLWRESSSLWNIIMAGELSCKLLYWWSLVSVTLPSSLIYSRVKKKKKNASSQSQGWLDFWVILWNRALTVSCVKYGTHRFNGLSVSFHCIIIKILSFITLLAWIEQISTQEICQHILLFLINCINSFLCEV